MPEDMTVGVADTMFARYDMAAAALDVLDDADVTVERYTVPGFKDLPVAAKKLIQEHGCDIVLALGMAGSADVDKTCAHEASQGLIQAELDTSTHILEVFVYEDEAKDPDALRDIFEDRTRKHAENALALLEDKEALTPRAGRGVRQGADHAGPIETDGSAGDRA